MQNAQPLGPAYAWEDAGQWFYATNRYAAPVDVVGVERFLVDGAVVLHLSSGHGGQFIRGATPVK